MVNTVDGASAGDARICGECLELCDEIVAEDTVGIRVPVTRFVCKIKMSPDTQRQVMAALRAPGPYQNPGLAADMARALSAE